METDEEVKKDENDIAEDEREEDEELSKSESDKNEVEEDQREESESVDDLKDALSKMAVENAELKEKLAIVTKERDEAHATFLGSEKESEIEKRSYASITNDIK